MEKSIETGLKVAREMLDPKNVAALEGSIGSEVFGSKLGEFFVDLGLGGVWGRPGLDRKYRSMVTIGILIANGQHDELKSHTLAAIKNGCTVKELEEVLYQSLLYTGFSAAASAYVTMITTLKQAGHLE